MPSGSCTIDFVRASNEKLKNHSSGLVGVFVGGSSGIGRATATSFAIRTLSPQIYIVGHSPDKAARVADELRLINPSSNVTHIAADLTLLKNVDQVCAQIIQRESKINFLCLSQGYLSTSGRDETTEGLDKKLSLNYYSRFRFAQKLLPLLEAASYPPRPGLTDEDSVVNKPVARILTILSAGNERSLNISDLPLRQKGNYTLRSAHDHACTMTSLSIRHLAKTYPTISFVHGCPGLVPTDINRGLGTASRYLMRGAYAVLKPWTVSLNESGERHLFLGVSDEFPAGAGLGSTKGRMERDGGGAYLVGASCEAVGNMDLLRRYQRDGTDEVVWRHTVQTFDEICGGC